MSANPLLGSRISLISKKNIRYEGTLYSINETDATVALQNVRAYGTEGRESENETFVPAHDVVHPYLLFRGCDIKDLHVHESSSTASNTSSTDNKDAEPEKSGKNGENELNEDNEKDSAEANEAEGNKNNDDDDDVDEEEANNVESNQKKVNNTSESKANEGKLSNTNNNRRRKTNSKPKKMVGSGASLLRLKARGVVDGDNGPENANETNFDFESNLAEFTKTTVDEEQTLETMEDDNIGTYDKNDFFDSISCDVSDRQNGIDNRLRGREERTLNTETFGATSLGYGGRRSNNRRYGGRGGGGGRGRGRGGRGRGRGSGRPRENNRWMDGNNQPSRGGRGGNRRTYGDGGLSANKAAAGSQ